MTEAWTLSRYKATPEGLAVKGVYSTDDRAKTAAEKDAKQPLTWQDATLKLGTHTFVGWNAYLGSPVDTIYEVTRFEVDAE